MKVKLILFAAVALLLSACGANNSYSHEAFQKFGERVQNQKELSSSDIDEGIDLFEGAVKELQKVGEQSDEEQKAYVKENPEIISDVLGLAFILAASEDKMSDSQKKRCEKLGNEMKELDKK